MKKTTCTVTFCSPNSAPDSLRAYLKDHNATEKDGVHTFQGACQQVCADLNLEQRKTDDLAIFLMFTNAYGALHLRTFPDSLGNGRSHIRGSLNQALGDASILARKVQTRYEARRKSPSPPSTAAV
jgi:hypothetical protein